MERTASKIEAGQFGEFAGAVVSQLWSIVKDKEPKELQKYIENTKLLKDVLAKVFGEKQASKYPISVDYGRSVKEAAELGKFGWVNDNINDHNFKTERQGKIELTIELLHLNRSVSSEEIFREIEEKGYRPTELHELLALGEKDPDLQRKFPIAALGSVWRRPSGFHGVPCLARDDSRRGLNLCWLEDDWGDSWRFAVVRK